MKVLLAVKSCERDAVAGFNQLIRETWAKDVVGADVRFFVGAHSQILGRTLESDEVRLDCADDYMSLPLKTRALLAWALAQGYDFVFSCDVDTYVVPDRLLASGFEKYDLMGAFNVHDAIGVPSAADDNFFAWPKGGPGYWLSRGAAHVVVDTPYEDWAEDRMIGQILGPWLQRGVLTAFEHWGYGFHFDGDEWRTDITSHYCSAGFKRQFPPIWMRNRYAHNTQGALFS